MGKGCMRCCKGSACCGCCCSKRFATMTFSLVGLVLAAAVIAPPAYVYATDRDFAKLFPTIRIARGFLAQVTEARFAAADNSRGEEVTEYDTEEEEEMDERGEDGSRERKRIKEVEPSPRDKYRMAIFQLLDDLESNAPLLSLTSFSLGCLNLPIHLLLLGGAAFRAPCLMLPWLAVTLLEHLAIGIPIIVLAGIMSLYLAAQLQLYLVAGAVIGSVVTLFLVSSSSWFTVYACYNEFYQRLDYYYESSAAAAAAESASASQPLIRAHTNGGMGYYPPHHQQHRQLPAAPMMHHGNGHMYPQLA